MSQFSITLATPASFSGPNALTTYDYGAGSVTVIQGQGWGQQAFNDIGSLGTSNLPPREQRT